MMKRLITSLLILFLWVQPAGADDALEELIQKENDLHNEGRYEEAIPYAEQILQIREKKLGEIHPDTAMSMNNVAFLYYMAGHYNEAEKLYEKTLEIKEKVFGRDHPSVALGLNNLADLYKYTGRYLEAELLFKKALEIKEKTLSKKHPSLAFSLNNLGEVYKAAGRYEKAEPLLKRALEINEEAFGPRNRNVAKNLNNLAGLYYEMGKYAESESLYKRALDIMERIFGPLHPDIATSLNNLAELYYEVGKYSDVERLLKRALEINERILGKEHPMVATSSNNLAVFYKSTDRYKEAESLYLNALTINQKALGPEHPYVARSLSNLALLYDSMGMYSEVEPLLKSAIEISEKSLGKDHPDVATNLNNLAVFYDSIQRHSESEPLHEKALQIRERVFGQYHPDVATSLTHLAELYAFTHRHQKSHECYKRSSVINDKTREEVFLLFSEKQMLHYMTQNEWMMHKFISHTLVFMHTDASALSDTFNAWLQWKGAVLEAQGRYMDALIHSEDPEISEKFDELTSARREFVRLQLSKPEKMSFEDYKKRLEEMEKKKEILEAELSRLSREFTLERLAGRLDLKRIAEILSKDSLYLDFAKTDIYDFEGKKWVKSKYLLFVLNPGKEPLIKLIDLGDTQAIDNHIKAYRKEIEEALKYEEPPKEDLLKREAKALYDLIIPPIEPFLKTAKKLFVSPDGNLNLIPFEVFITPEGKYLMEDYLIDYVGAGRDMIRFTDTAVPKQVALIMADPDFDLGLKEKEKVANEMNLPLTLKGPVSRDTRGLHFQRLPDTKQEADSIEKILRDQFQINVANYQDRKALEEILFSTQSPRFLHLSTHGYFLKDEEVKHLKKEGLTLSEREMVPATGIENPMLRSGIVLAGVNASLQEGRDEGLISAEKILGLRLKGTELVVLSACETGVGDVENGEGVFGLKRAFILSGAKTLVISLWSVPSQETTELMMVFYRLMAQGKTKAEALREAKIGMMRKNQNPFFWGAFVMVGKPY